MRLGLISGIVPISVSKSTGLIKDRHQKRRRPRNLTLSLRQPPLLLGMHLAHNPFESGNDRLPARTGQEGADQELECSLAPQLSRVVEDSACHRVSGGPTVPGGAGLH